MRLKKSLIIILSIVLILNIFISLLFYTVGPTQLSNPKEEIVYFKKNSNAAEFAKYLKNQNLIRSSLVFKILAKISTLDKRLKPGTYKLSTNMDSFTILFIISGLKGAPILQRITIPEGTAIDEMPRILKKANIVCADNFVDYVKNTALSDFKNSYDFLQDLPVDSLEGYLFPDTYFIDFETPPKYIVELMLNRFSEVISPLYGTYTNKKLNLHKLLTLASVVEKECHVDNERSLVAGVFLKRLKIGMPLESDPTVKYAKKEYDKKIVLFRDLRFNSPYNTYYYKGLPPGPICSIGKESFEAVLYPKNTDYLFFVAKGDGSHIFGKTPQEHFRNIAKVRSGKI